MRRAWPANAPPRVVGSLLYFPQRPYIIPFGDLCPPRDSDPGGLFLSPQKYLLL